MLSKKLNSNNICPFVSIVLSITNIAKHRLHVCLVCPLAAAADPDVDHVPGVEDGHAAVAEVALLEVEHLHGLDAAVRPSLHREQTLLRDLVVGVGVLPAQHSPELNWLPI